MGVFDKASLALVPDGIKDGKLYSIKPTDGSGDFTFERGFNLAATRVDENGLIEKGRENLAKNTNWEGASLDTAPTDYAGYLLYNGTFNTTSIEGQIRFTTDSSSRAILITSNISETGIFTQSVYVDEVYTSLAVKDVINRSTGSTIIAYYEDGVEITGTTNVQAGKRYSIIWNKTGATSFRFGSGVNSPMAGDIVLSRPQIERGLVATELIVSPVGSTGKAGILEDLPRIDYTGGTPSLLLEPSRTNLITNSEYLGEELTGNRMAINDVVDTSPEGVVNASKLVPDTTPNQTHQSDTNNYGSFVSGDKITISIFAKADGFDGIILRFKDDSGAFTTNRMAIFDLNRGRWENLSMDGTTGVMTGEVGMEDYGNGWYRCFATATADALGDVDIRIPVVDVTAQDTYDETFTGDSTSGVLIYGLQLEAGSYPTSYIPTYGAIATRASDDVTGSPLSIDGLFGATEGSIFLEFTNPLPLELVNNSFYLTGQGGASSGYQRLRGYWQFYFPGLTISPTSNLGNVKEHSKILAKWGNGSIKIFTDGVEDAASTYTGGDINMNGELSNIVGSYDFAAGDSRIKTMLFFPEALSDAECITLTT